MGVKTVINLCAKDDEHMLVQSAGMRSICIPIDETSNNLREKVDHLVALMADPDNRPVFVHCRNGQKNTGIVVAAYRMKVQGWSLADAEAEMQDFGFKEIWINFKKFIHRYAADIGKS